MRGEAGPGTANQNLVSRRRRRKTAKSLHRRISVFLRPLRGLRETQKKPALPDAAIRKSLLAITLDLGRGRRKRFQNGGPL